MGGGARFAQAVPLLDRELGSLVDCFDQLLRQRCCATTHHSEGTEIILVDSRMFAKGQHNRWHDVRIGDLVVLYHRADLFEIEFWHDGDCESTVDGLMYNTDQAWAG